MPNALILGLTVDTALIKTNSRTLEEATDIITMHLPALVERLDDVDQAGYLTVMADEDETPEVLAGMLTTGYHWVASYGAENSWEIPGTDRSFVVGAGDASNIDYTFPEYDEVRMFAQAVKTVPALGAELGIHGEGLVLP